MIVACCLLVIGFCGGTLWAQERARRHYFRRFSDKYNEQMDYLILQYKTEQNKLRQRMDDQQEYLEAEIAKLMEITSEFGNLPDTEITYIADNMEAMLKDA